MADRFTAEQRNGDWTVVDQEEQHQRIVHKAHWPEKTARHIAEVLNAHPYHAEEWES